MAEYFDIDSDGDIELERDPVMILSTVPTGDLMRVPTVEHDDRFAFDEDTADTDPLGEINPYVDV